jgi:hypothetical protein
MKTPQLPLMKFHRNLAIAGIAAVCVAGSGTATAAPILDVTYDFGTDPGKTTLADAGFATYAQAGTITDLADSAAFDGESGSGFINQAALRTFTGMGGTNTHNFTFEMTAKLSELIPDDGGNAQRNIRFGINMFGSSSEGTDGLTAQINTERPTTNSGTAILQLRTGPNGDILSSANWAGGRLLPDDEFRYVVTGTYGAGTDLLMSFTFSNLDGTDSTSITHTVDRTLFAGTSFGMSSRTKADTIFEVDTFSLTVIPEPCTAALLIGGVAMMMGLRRRRSA